MCSQAGGQSALDLPMESRATGQLSYSIAVRQSFAFALPFSAGTGYSWSVLKRPDPRVAEPIGIWTVGSVDRPGGPGRAIVVSRGTGVGTTAFTVVYSRPWEHGVAPAKTVTVQVRVAKPPAGCPGS
jgi:inhibitor of cysteine peptidase